MMKWILFLLFIQVSVWTFGQKIDWSKTRRWKIYAINKDIAFGYPADTLYHFKNAAMDDSAVISFFTQSKQWPKRQYASWMGMYIASYEMTDGRLRKVVLSSYGGFFYDSATGRYYELPGELRKDWNEFMIENLKKVFDE